MATETDHIYRQRVAACWLGKAVGSTLGSPVEGLDGPHDLEYYPSSPSAMLPNGGLDLEIVYAGVLDRLAEARVDRQVLAGAWRDHVDLVQDEYAVAKRNLSLGLAPPLTGSFDNWFNSGLGAAGRSELWACLAPGNPEVASAYAYEDACIDHAGDGIWALVFLAALQSAAFTESDPETLLETALRQIPSSSPLSCGVQDTQAWWAQSGDWLKTRQQILETYGKTNYTDVTMNVAFVVLAWLAGGGDFEKTVCIAVNCGKATASNGASAGALFGILYPDAIPEKWIAPLAGQNVTAQAESVGLAFEAVIEAEAPAEIVAAETETPAEIVAADGEAPSEIAAAEAETPSDSIAVSAPVEAASEEEPAMSAAVPSEALTEAVAEPAAIIEAQDAASIEAPVTVVEATPVEAAAASEATPVEAIATPSAASESEAAEATLAAPAEPISPVAAASAEPLEVEAPVALAEAEASVSEAVPAAAEAVVSEPVQATEEPVTVSAETEPVSLETAAVEPEAGTPAEAIAEPVAASAAELAASTPLKTSAQSAEGQPETIGALTDLIVRLHERLGERYPEVPDDPPYVSRSMITASMAFVPSMPETNGSAPAMPAEAMTLTFPGTTGLLPTEIFGGDAALIRYTITLPEARTVRVMFNASAANQVWFDDKPVFSTTETRMAPSFHRVAEDQRADLTLEAGKHQLIAAIRKPQSGLYLEWVVGMADAGTLQWLTDVTYAAT